MRVISGSCKGKKLKCLPGLQIRPTSDRLKEAFFSLSASRVEGCYFLDCFAGCGGMGIEALSRGAAEAVFIESNKAACSIVKQNLQLCGFKKKFRLLSFDWKRALKRLEKEEYKFDILFFDPPYHQFSYEKILEYLASGRLLNQESLIALEHYWRLQIEPLREAFSCYTTLRAGDSCITLLNLRNKP